MQKPQWVITSHQSEWLSAINQQTSAGEDVEKEELSCTVGGNADWCSHYGNSMELPQKIKNGTVLWLSDSSSGNISEEARYANSKEYLHPYVHGSIIYSSQDLEAVQVPTNRWVDKKLHYIYTIEYYLVRRRKEGNLTCYNSMDGPGEHAKWNVRERQISYNFTCMSNLVNKIS